MSSRVWGGWLTVFLLYAAVATALGHVDYHIRASPERGFAEYSPGVVAGTEPAPGRYRILAPYAFSGLVQVAGLSPRTGWVLFRWLSLLAALLATHLYLATWFDRGPAVTGTLLTASLLPLTFTNGWAHPDHLFELGLFTLGCACIARGWTSWLVLVLVANGLNRETSAFLVPLFLLARPLHARHVRQAIGLGAVWLAVYVGLRWVLGFEAYDPWQLTRNLSFFALLPPGFDPYYRAYAWFVVILVGPLVWAAVGSWPRLPRMVRAGVSIVAPVFVLTAMLFSSVIETRIFTPLLPLLVPVAVFALFPATHRDPG